MTKQLETGSFLGAAESSVSPDTIRVVSWNINRGQQLNRVLDFLRRTAADLVLLQEVDVNARRTQYRKLSREIAEALQMDYVFGLEFEELTQRNHNGPAYHGQLTLSRLPISDSRILTFQRQSDFWRPRWFLPEVPLLQRRLGARIALVTSIEWIQRPLMVYNVHLESRGKDQLRCSQLAEIFADVRKCGEGVPVLIAGDFNFDLCQGRAASVLADSGFDNPFANCQGATSRSRLGRARAIDWILTRAPMNCADPELHDSVGGSDHYPLSMILHSNESTPRLG